MMVPVARSLVRSAWVAIIALVVVSTARADERVVLIAGGGEEGPGSPAVKCRLEQPFGVDFDLFGNTYVVEMTANRVMKVDAGGNLQHVAGTGEKGNGGDGGPAVSAQFNGPHSLVVGRDGEIYVADTWNNRIRKIDPATGIITNFAGTGEKGFAGDGGPADQAQFGGVYCVAFDPGFARMYVADLDNRRIRAIDMRTKIVSTIAGNGEKGVPQDGAKAVESPLVDPRAVAADRGGNVYILERSGHALRVVKQDGMIRTVAGTGKAGYSGDGGDALQAELNGPKHLCVLPNGTVLIADTENDAIRRYRPSTGKIERVAGTGGRGAEGIGGNPQEVQLAQPHGVAVDRAGRIYVADSSNHRVLRIEEPLPEGIVLEEHLTYATVDGSELKLDLARPKEGGPHPGIVFIHGGGWYAGSRFDYRRSILEAAQRGYVAVSIGYRLMKFDESQRDATTATWNFPVQVEDAKAAVRWLRAHAEKYGVAADRIGVTGGSAGGHLALMVGLGDDEAGPGEGSPTESSRVQAVVNVFGPTEMAECYRGSSVAWILRLFMGGTPEERPEAYRAASPVTYVSADDPPVLTLHGGKDELVPVSQARLLDKALQEAGVPHALMVFDDQGHGFGGASAEQATRAMWEFFDTHLKRK